MPNEGLWNWVCHYNWDVVKWPPVMVGFAGRVLVLPWLWRWVNPTLIHIHCKEKTPPEDPGKNWIRWRVTWQKSPRNNHAFVGTVLKPQLQPVETSPYTNRFIRRLNISIYIYIYLYCIYIYIHILNINIINIYPIIRSQHLHYVSILFQLRHEQIAAFQRKSAGKSLAVSFWWYPVYPNRFPLYPHSVPMHHQLCWLPSGKPI